MIRNEKKEEIFFLNLNMNLWNSVKLSSYQILTFQERQAQNLA